MITTIIAWNIHGCLAQLGEHLFDVQKVRSSSLLLPTNRKLTQGKLEFFYLFILIFSYEKNNLRHYSIRLQWNLNR